MAFTLPSPWEIRRELPNLSGRIVVFDLEMTTWPGTAARFWSGDGEDPEIVQIGAVALDADDDLKEVGTFKRLVRPAFHPILSDYFTELTGITQAVVDQNGNPFELVLDEFVSFCKNATAILSNGEDAHVLDINCHMHKRTLPLGRELFIDLSAWFMKVANNGGPRINSSNLLKHLSLPDTMAAHDALADARRVARSLAYLTS